MLVLPRIELEATKKGGEVYANQATGFRVCKAAETHENSTHLSRTLRTVIPQSLKVTVSSVCTPKILFASFGCINSRALSGDALNTRELQESLHLDMFLTSNDFLT